MKKGALFAFVSMIAAFPAAAGSAYPPIYDEGAAPSGLEDVATFDDRVAFLAAAGQLPTESFEAAMPSGTPTSGGVDELEFAGFFARSDLEALKIFDQPTGGNHNTTPGGTVFLSADSDEILTSPSVTLEFKEAITSFGLFVIDLDLSALFIRINNISYMVPATGHFGQAYFGIITDAPFTTVEITISATDDHYSLDDISFGGDCFPAVSVTLNTIVLQPGQQILSDALVQNLCANPIDVEMKTWLEQPNGGTLALLDSHTTGPVFPGVPINLQLLDRVFNGSEPGGAYNIGARLLDPITGDLISEWSVTFTFVP